MISTDNWHYMESYDGRITPLIIADSISVAASVLHHDITYVN